MDQERPPFTGSLLVPSLKDLCLQCIAASLPSDVQLKVQPFVQYLLPDDAVEVLYHSLESHGTRMGICPYRLLLPRPGVFLQLSHLRGKLLRICRNVTPDAASLCARDTLLSRIPKATSQEQLAGPLQLGSFLCEMGWCDDGMLVLAKIHSALSDNTSWFITDMSLDCAFRQLESCLSAGRLAAARHRAARVHDLLSRSLERRSGLMSAAAAAMARFHLLTENWTEAAQWLGAALDSLPAAVPADLSAELARLVAELLLSRGLTTPLIELAPQALSAAYRQYGELHPQTLAAVRMLVDFAGQSGLSGLAQDLSQETDRLSEAMFDEFNPVRQRIRLDRALLAMRFSATDAGTDSSSGVLATVNPASLPLPRDSCWLLERTQAQCQWMEEQIPALLDSEHGMQRAYQLSGQIVYHLRRAAELCEEVFGPNSLRLARLLTELGRQYFSLEMDDLLDPHGEGGAVEGERLLRRALSIQASHRLPPEQRDSLVTRITLASLYTYSHSQYLMEAERLMRAALNECYGGERRRHPELAEHCLRALSYIYTRHEDTERAAAMDELLETVASQRRTLAGQRLPAGGLTSLLPRRPWSQSEMTGRLRAALRALSAAAPSPEQAWEQVEASGGGM